MARKNIVIIVLLACLALLLHDFITNGYDVFVNYFEAPYSKEILNINSYTPKVSRKDEQSIDRNNIIKLQLYNPYGEVIVQGEERADIKIDAEITIYAADQKQAQTYLNKVKVNLKKSGSTLEVFISPNQTHSEEFSGMKIDYVVKVPRGLDLKIDAYNFLRVDNIQGDVDLRSDGKTEITKVEGSVLLVQRQGVARVNDIDGNVTVNGLFFNYDAKNQPSHIGDFADLILDNINGKTSFYLSRGQTFLRNINGDITGDVFHGSVRAVDIQGEISFRGVHFSSNLSDVSKKISITSSHGDIILQNIQNNVDISCFNADIGVISELEHKVDAETSHGDIVFIDQEFEIRAEKHQETYQGIIGDGRYDMRLKNNYGNIYFQTEID